MDEPIPSAPPTPPVPPVAPVLPPTEKSRTWLKISLAAIGILIILGLFGNLYLLARNQKPVAEVTPTPIPTTTITVPDETANWKTYTNTKYGYQIKYPEQLTVKERSSKNPEAGMGDIVIQATDMLLPQNQGPAHFSIQISSEDYQTIITRLENDYWGGLRESPNRAEGIKIAGIAGKKILGTQVSSGYQYLAIYFPKGNLTYTIGFIIGPEELKLGWNEGTFGQILSTFKFLD